MTYCNEDDPHECFGTSRNLTFKLIICSIYAVVYIHAA